MPERAVRLPDTAVCPPVTGLRRNIAVLGSLNITLSAFGNASLPGNGGQSLHGLVMSVVAGRNATLVEQLHDLDGPAPFSLSPLDGCVSRDGNVALEAGNDYSFRLNLLETGLLAEATAAFFETRSCARGLRLGGAGVTVKSVEPWETRGSPFVLYENLLARAGGHNELALEFLSPTAFRVKGKNYVFPDPELVFGSLLNRWNAFSHRPFSSATADGLSSIMVSRFAIESDMVSFSRFKYIGFKGHVVYRLPEAISPEQARAGNCLADFAGYAGVGWKTTMGLGRTRRLDIGGALHHRTGGHS